jgi:hypothetical protein
VDVGGNVIKNNVVQGFTYGLIFNNGTLCSGVVEQNVIHRNTHGLYIGNAAQGIVSVLNLRANIFSRNTNAIRYNPADISANTGAIQWARAAFDCNFFYSNGTNYSQLPSGTGDTTLTADPFTDEASRNFTLNAVAGGGQTVRDTVCSTTFADGINSSRTVAGFNPSPAPASDAASYTSSMRSLWREVTGEVHETPVPNSRVDVYLDFGLQEVNRHLHYHVTTIPVKLFTEAAVERSWLWVQTCPPEPRRSTASELAFPAMISLLRTRFRAPATSTAAPLLSAVILQFSRIQFAAESAVEKRTAAWLLPVFTSSRLRQIPPTPEKTRRLIEFAPQVRTGRVEAVPAVISPRVVV